MSESNNHKTNSRPSPLVAEQRNNKVTRDLWSEYAGHRKVMTGLVQSVATSLRRSELPTLCVLGAGNINDLSLAALVPMFAKIRLVDFDRQAVESGIAKQTSAEENSDVADLLTKRVSFVGPFDLLGASDLLATGLEQKASADKQDDASITSVSNSLREALAFQRPKHAMTTLGCSDIVVSACVLSQLVRQVNDVIGQGSSLANLLSSQIVFNHLQLSLALTKAGGRTLLATDFVRSSDGVPELEKEEDPAKLQLLANRAIQSGKYFANMSPTELLEGLNDVRLRRYVSAVTRSSFWKWKIGQHNQYLCHAIAIAHSSVPWGAAAETAEDRLAATLRGFVNRTGMACRSLTDSEIEKRSPEKES